MELGRGAEQLEGEFFLSLGPVALLQVGGVGKHRPAADQPVAAVGGLPQLVDDHLGEVPQGLADRGDLGPLDRRVLARLAASRAGLGSRAVAVIGQSSSQGAEAGFGPRPIYS